MNIKTTILASIGIKGRFIIDWDGVIADTVDFSGLRERY